MLLDVRPAAEFMSGHIKNAISVPTDQLLSCLKTFSRDKEFIAYCRGPFCVLADEAVRILHDNGFKVRRLDEGYPEWKVRQQDRSELN